MKDQALYLEADEDITSAIDKLVKATGTSVQIVVPKRSTLLQSIINLKLLKKSAADHGKQLVLVTNDKVATDLAARLGLAVAPVLGAKAILSEAAPQPQAATEDIINEDDPEPDNLESDAPHLTPETQKRLPLFKRKAVSGKLPVVIAAVTEPIEEAASEPNVTPVPEASEAAASREPRSKSNSLVPNFGKLQKRIGWLALAAIIITGYFIYINIAAKATIILSAAGTKVAVDSTFSVDPNQTTSNIPGSILAGQTISYSKDLTGQATATGQQDAGTKASGQMTIYNTYDTNSHVLSAGTRFAAPDGNIFTTNSDTTVPGATPTLKAGQLSLQPGTITVPVTASLNGDKYNEAPAKYTIVAYSGDMQAKIYGQGAQMSGGTSKLVTILSQDDVSKAQADILAADKDNAQKALDSHAPSGYVILTGSTNQTVGNVTSNPAVNAAASSATVTVHITYTELSVKETDYRAFIRAKEQSQIGKSNQIYDDGISSAVISAAGKDSAGHAQFSLSTQAYSGAKIDTSVLASELAGKKYGDASDIAARQPGIQHVAISLSPSWLTSLPHNAAKINIAIQVASGN
jgi:hypothetical protein